ncbi:TonB-dependent receptor [Marinimicrobium sp. C6131]|uniref:TonB-dependent receptor n=1 Tax=Marinimicrobium sp. C6131 TaxID=3022676 RepID=UPI00223CF2CC|nr:TonB-dependent receptor [Marinimicrobium sp. C6131]UZJ44702.1 TonB-dependent receptor [Marinimicrobium sp. C6131]
MSRTNKYTPRLLSSVIAAVVASGASSYSNAQDQGLLEEVVVTGIRGAQEQSIDIKRNSDEVVDAITSEDIGKLPDSTIADSLQRVTGIQIQRSAGQGGVVSIRGSNEVLTTLNGELFLTAQNILNSNADYQDIPASLISGVVVSKSSNAKQLEGGIGGTVDLQTRRSLMLDEGVTSVARLQASTGSITETTDPEVNGLIGFNNDDRYGMSLAFAYADQSLASNQTQTRAGVQNRADALMMMNWDGPVSTNFITERERVGLSYNFNAQLSDSLELNIDSFYNSMDEKSAGNMFQFDLDSVGWDYGRMQPEGVRSAGDVPVAQGAYATGWTADMNSAIRAGVSSNFRETSAVNNSVELKFDNGGNFTGSVRYISSQATRDADVLTLVQRPSSPGENGLFDDRGYVYNLEGDYRQVNPGYLGGNYTTTFLTHDDGVTWEFGPTFAQEMTDSSAWYIHSSWLEGERHTANLDVLRADGTYRFGNDGITSMDFGIRESTRGIERDSHHYFMPTGITAYDPADMQPYDMLVKYHEAGYVYGTGQGNDGTSGTYLVETPEGSLVELKEIGLEPVRGLNLDDSALQGYIHQVSDFGETVKSFNSSLPMINVDRIDNNLTFIDDIYDADHVRKNRPDQSYVIDEDRQSLYFKFNFYKDLTSFVTLSGNAGVRRVTDTLTIKQNVYDSNRLGRDVFAGSDPNHTYYVDSGDKYTTVTHSSFLPSLNANVSFGDDYKIKVSYDERTSLQALDQFGQGTFTSWQSEQVDPNTGNRYQAISEVRLGGNPNLQPWSAKVYNVAGEWYPSDNALIGLTAFYMDIGGFTEEVRTTDLTLPDSDGVVRRGGTVIELRNGSNASVEGVELSYQQSFDFLPGFMSNTGMTWNYTYSPSTREGVTFAADGEDVPFNATAEDQSNLVLWYSSDLFELRAAANYLGPRYNGTQTAAIQSDDESVLGGLPVWDEETLYVDLNAVYHMNDAIDVTLNFQNLTEEGANKYMHWKNFRQEYNAFERRISVGVSAKF